MLILEELLTQITGCVWFPAETAPTAARMICPDLDTTLVFNAQNLVLDQAPVGDVEFDFPAAAAESLAVIVGRFGLGDMRPFGWRQIKLLPTGDLDEAEKLSVKYSPARDWRESTSDDLQPREYEQSYRFESADRARGLRISIRPFSRHGACPHGTHVAGTAGAIGNNGIGVAGVSWGVKIMPIRVLNGCGGTEAQCAAGIVWATDNGAHVGTMSLQYYVGADVFRDSVEYAYQSGVLLIAANGNGRGRLVAFPAKYEHCMGISATTHTDALAGFSNYGPECDVSAPGDSVWSLENGGGYSFKSGTSMATPHTSGLASLMLSYNPGLSPDEIEQILKDTSDDKGAPGWDEQFGWGRINARQALEASGGDPSPAACCYGDGACEDQLRNDCVDNGGRWNFGKECGTFDCPLPGACCITNSECEVMLERDCTIQGGSFLGEGESCFRACPCDKVKKMKGNCKGSGTIKGTVKFIDDSFDGKTVKMGVGERLRFDVTVRGKKATLYTCCFSGEQTISLLEPEGCLEPIVVTCN